MNIIIINKRMLFTGYRLTPCYRLPSARRRRKVLTVCVHTEQPLVGAQRWISSTPCVTHISISLFSFYLLIFDSIRATPDTVIMARLSN
jgi:hypothetical protein